MVKKGRASMRMGRLSIRSQTEQADRNEDRNDEQERRTSGSATRPFIDPVVRAGVTTRSDVSSESGALIGHRPAHGLAAMTGSGSTLLPARWYQAAESSRSEHRDTNHPAPHPVILIALH